MSRHSYAAAIAAFFLLGACVGSGPDSVGLAPSPPDPDGGGADDSGLAQPPDVEGKATGEMALSLPDGKLTLVRGSTASVKVTLERKGSFAGAVNIAIVGAPAGLTAKPLELASDATTGDLELAVGKDVPQGDLANVHVSASNPALKDRATFPLTAFVRGAPGDIDTSYGDQGVVTLGTLFDIGIPNPTTGEVYFSSSGLKRYRADGTLDASFSGSTITGPLAGNYIYSCDATGTGGEPEAILSARRVSIVTGQADTVFRPVSPTLSGNVSKYDCLASAAGNVALIGASYGATATPAYGHVAWFSPAGAYTTRFSTGSPDDFRVGVFVADGIVVSTTAGIAKIKTGATALDTSFGAGGRVTLAGAGALTSIVEDADKKLLVANATYTARVTAAGSLDGTFVPASTGLAPTPGQARLAVQGDGKILKAVQLGTGDGRACAISRYLPTGALDATFGDQGNALYPVTPCSPALLAVTADKKILVGSPKVLRIWD
ncbi:MAG: hypothetical protein KF894_00440 [Labilithrix sp.]|nr:hypothetical protein [Labilithrix sp.]